MNHNSEKQLVTFRTDHSLSPLLDRQDAFSPRMVVLPASDSGGAGATPGEFTVSVVTSTIDDSFDEATWEDAEWRR